VKTLLSVLVLVCISISASAQNKPTDPKEEQVKSCQEACNRYWTKQYHDCGTSQECVRYVEHQYRRCVLDCAHDDSQ
jgi:hypothetical protein